MLTLREKVNYRAITSTALSYPKTIPEPAPGTPKHVAIIMDGNGRWARQRNLPRIEGHRRGVENVKEVVKAAGEAGIKYLTLYAFSVENWKRPQSEVDALMEILLRFLRSERKQMMERDIKLGVIGKVDALPGPVQQELANSLEATKNNERGTLILALNYGARTEVLDAVRKYAEAVQRGEEDVDALDWTVFAQHLYTGAVPDPDLIIRTSGETRLSNFLLLQAAYSEMYFTPVLWPDFTAKHFEEALDDFRRRERRFGKTGEQLNVTPELTPVVNP